MNKANYAGKTIEAYTNKGILFSIKFDDLVNNGFKASRIIKSIELGISYRGMNYRIKNNSVIPSHVNNM